MEFCPRVLYQLEPFFFILFTKHASFAFVLISFSFSCSIVIRIISGLSFNSSAITRQSFALIFLEPFFICPIYCSPSPKNFAISFCVHPSFLFCRSFIYCLILFIFIIRYLYIFLNFILYAFSFLSKFMRKSTLIGLYYKLNALLFSLFIL